MLVRFGTPTMSRSHFRETFERNQATRSHSMSKFTTFAPLTQEDVDIILSASETCQGMVWGDIMAMCSALPWRPGKPKVEATLHEKAALVRGAWKGAAK